jgi:hypothetical protein
MTNGELVISEKVKGDPNIKTVRVVFHDRAFAVRACRLVMERVVAAAVEACRDIMAEDRKQGHLPL